MALGDESLDQLRNYKPPVTAQHDFSAFWKQGLDSLRSEPISADVTAKGAPFRGFKVYDVQFHGDGGAEITGELIVPDGAHDAPGLVVYHGYGSRAAGALELLPWAAIGAVVLSVNVRGQRGDASDNAVYDGPRIPGFLTAGIQDPQQYYYRHVYLDCVRAVDVLAERPEVDDEKLAVLGGSQGGGLSLAVAALEPRVSLCMASVPFLCDFPGAVKLAAGAYQEIARYCQRSNQREIAAVFQTLTYFDIVNLAGRVRARTLISVGLRDPDCPPSTVFAVYNHLTCPKRIEVYPFMGHEVNPAFIELCMQEMVHQFDLHRAEATQA